MRHMYVEAINSTFFDMEKEFHILNRLLFNDEIDLNFILRWNNSSKVMGKVDITAIRRGREYSDVKVKALTLTNFYGLPENILRDILVHEMIHVIIAQRGNATEVHGPIFQTEMNRINRSFPEFNIRPTEDVSDYPIEGAKEKTLYVIVITFDDFVGFAVLGKEPLDEELQYILNRSSAEKVEVGKTSNPSYQKYTISRSVKTAIKRGLYKMKDGMYSDLDIIKVL